MFSYFLAGSKERMSLFRTRYARTIHYFLHMALLFTWSAYVGYAYRAYEEFWWLDVIMHFLGGFLSAGFASSFVSEYLKKEIISLTVLFSFVIFVLWEIAEYLEIIGDGPFFWRDTIEDIIMDTLGLIAFLLFVRGK